MSRKRIPLNQNGCTANFRIGVPFEQNLHSDMYQVFARYLEIDSEPYVMEMLKKLDENTLTDEEGYEKLTEKLTVYSEKLYRDVLTGAYNRRYFEEKVKNMSLNAGVAVIDLDDFKLFNDTYGHDGGDLVLTTVVNVIRHYIRRTDILVRYGGDEFLLILPGAFSEHWWSYVYPWQIGGSNHQSRQTYVYGQGT